MAQPQNSHVSSTPARARRKHAPSVSSSTAPSSQQQQAQPTLSDRQHVGPADSCPYEYAPLLGRRRMAYDMGDEKLTKLDSIKQALSADEERNLAAAADELYHRLLPSAESEDRRRQFSVKLQRMLEHEWPDYKFTVHVFGSSGNLLCTTESDVDVCIETDFDELESMHPLADLLARNGMEKVVCIPSAKVPIVKVWDPQLQLACDMNVNNTLALDNTRMVRTYVQLDRRVRPLAMIVKYWTKQRMLNDAAIGGTLSSYTWICLTINFLQTRDPPVLPALHQLPHQPKLSADGSDNGFATDLTVLKDKSDNGESLAKLLFGFFRKYAHELEYEKSVLSVRHGKILTRQDKGWQSTSKDGRWRLCVEEPFNVDRNLGNSADDTSFKGIHLEFRRAFDLVAKADLTGCCDQFEWPQSDEKKSAVSSIFQKPSSSQAKPVLLSQPPRPGRQSNPTTNSSGNNNNSNTNSSSNSSNNRARHNSGSKAAPYRRASNTQHGHMFTSQQFAGPNGSLVSYVQSDGGVFLLPSESPLRANGLFPISIASAGRFPYLVSPQNYNLLSYPANLTAWAASPTQQDQPGSQNGVHLQAGVAVPKSGQHGYSNMPALTNGLAHHRASTGALSPPKQIIQPGLSSTVPAAAIFFDDRTGPSVETTASRVPRPGSKHDSDTSSPFSDQDRPANRSSVSDASTVADWSRQSGQPDQAGSAGSGQVTVPNTGTNTPSQSTGRADYGSGSAGTPAGSSPRGYNGWMVSPDGNVQLRSPYPHFDPAHLHQYIADPARLKNRSSVGLGRNSPPKRMGRSGSPTKPVVEPVGHGQYPGLDRSPTELTHDGSILIANGSHPFPAKSVGGETPESGPNVWQYSYDWLGSGENGGFPVSRANEQFGTVYPNGPVDGTAWADSEPTQFHMEAMSVPDTGFGSSSDSSADSGQAQQAAWPTHMSDSFGQLSMGDRTLSSPERRLVRPALSPVWEHGRKTSPVRSQQSHHHHHPVATADGTGKSDKTRPKPSGLARPRTDDQTGTTTKSGPAGRRLSTGTTKKADQWQWQQWQPVSGRARPSKDDKLTPIPVNVANRKGG